VFTDKLVAKIPSTATGVITKINYGDEDVCPVGHSLFTIELDEGEEAEVEAPAQSSNTSEVETAAATASACPLASSGSSNAQQQVSGPGNSQPLSKALSTPAVRFIAKKEGININVVPATGKNGRVTKTDLLNFMAGKTQPLTTASGNQQQS
jgi:pyruvate/2-oxoglutarate dehydrogenase complex dihydrolipoamide acyltransferase (E2) component